MAKLFNLLWQPVHFPTSRRMLFIDALRGVLIIMVVWVHFENFWAPPYEGTPHTGLYHFRMPSFFFITGFFSAICFGGPQLLRHKLKRRLEVQLIPTLIFITIYFLIYSPTFEQVFVNPYKYGFWFTWSAVILIAIYGTLWTISRAITKSHLLQVILTTTAALAIAAIVKRLPIPEYWDKLLSLSKSILYLSYFIAGVVAREYAPLFFSIIQRRATPICLIAVAIIGYQMGREWPLWDKIWVLSGIIGAFALCYHLSPIIEHTRPGRTLAHIGQYTLEIYLLQALLFSTHFSEINWIPPHWNTLIQISIRLAISIIITIILYTMAKILPPWIQRILFGRKETTNFAHK